MAIQRIRDTSVLRRLRLEGVGTEQIDALKAIGLEFHQRGWCVGSSGNFSLRLPGEPSRLLITASGEDKGRLGVESFVVVDADGVAVDPLLPTPSAETLLHTVICNATGAGAVLHIHSVGATVLSDRHGDAGGVTIDGYEMLKGLAGVTSHEHREWVEIFENTQDLVDLSRRVAVRLADGDNPLQHGFLLRRHGLYTWGRDVAEARRHVEVFEFLFEVLARGV
jgi:methylthioribulose-1-phosphate dehydratase